MLDSADWTTGPPWPAVEVLAEMIGTMARRSSPHLRRLGGCCACAMTLALFLAPGSAFAHAGLLRSDPAAGAALGASPTAVRLTFTERPQASLSRLRVLDARGNPVRTAPVAGSGVAPAAPGPKLSRGPVTGGRGGGSPPGRAPSLREVVFGGGGTPPEG